MASTHIEYQLSEDSDGSPWPSDSSDKEDESNRTHLVPAGSAEPQNPYRFEPVRDSSSSSDGNGSESDDHDRLNNTSWCECNHCCIMPTAKENLCCQEVDQFRDKCTGRDPPVCCLILHPSFEAVCLNTDVLDTAYYQFRQQYKTDDSSKRPDERYRHISYRQVVRWCYGWLGRDVRRVIPSCIITAIRKRFPSPTEEYEGFKYK